MAKKGSVVTRAVHQGVNAAGGRSEYVRLENAWWSVLSKHRTKAQARSKRESFVFLFPRAASMRVVKLNTGKWAVVQRIGRRWEKRHAIY